MNTYTSRVTINPTREPIAGPNFASISLPMPPKCLVGTLCGPLVPQVEFLLIGGRQGESWPPRGKNWGSGEWR